MRVTSGVQASFILQYVLSKGTKSQISLKNCMLPMFKKTPKFERFDHESRPRPF